MSVAYHGHTKGMLVAVKSVQCINQVCRRRAIQHVHGAEGEVGQLAQPYLARNPGSAEVVCGE